MKENKRERGTNVLEIVKGEIGQESKGKQVTEGHSQTGKHRGRDKSGEQKKRITQGNRPTGECQKRDKSGQRKKASKQEALTYWRMQRKVQVRDANESK